MNIYECKPIGSWVSADPYVGRGIVVGRSADGSKAVMAYFIMGRSENSRNRIFVEEGQDVVIYPFDPAKVEDPSLIIYSPIRHISNQWIVTNGDQTDTIFDGLQQGKTFAQALSSRCFEPDAPNLTPRISALLDLEGDFTYQMSILKSADEAGTACNRYTFDFESLAGVGHFIHTYAQNENPLPTFQGEPKRVALGNDIDALAQEIWDNLNGENRISLYVRTVNLTDGTVESRMVNKYQKGGQ